MIQWATVGGGTKGDGQTLIESSWSPESRRLVGLELEKGSARVHHLDLIGSFLGRGEGTHMVVPKGGRPPSEGFEG